MSGGKPHGSRDDSKPDNVLSGGGKNAIRKKHVNTNQKSNKAVANNKDANKAAVKETANKETTKKDANVVEIIIYQFNKIFQFNKILIILKLYNEESF